MPKLFHFSHLPVSHFFAAGSLRVQPDEHLEKKRIKDVFVLSGILRPVRLKLASEVILIAMHRTV